MNELTDTLKRMSGKKLSQEQIDELVCEGIEADKKRIEKLERVVKKLIGMYIVDDYISGEMRERQIEETFKRMIEAE